MASSNYPLFTYQAILYVRGMIVVRQFILYVTIFFVILGGCSHQREMNTLYEATFDALLKDDEYISEMDYISLFIQHDDVTRADFSAIEKYIKGMYHKDTYSYIAQELLQSGAYGKENLDEEGVYLYITDLEMDNRQAIVHCEKYYTVTSIKPLGMELTFKKTDNEWVLDETKVEWRGKPE